MRKARSKSSHYAVCLNNDGYEASLEAGKIYRLVPDAEASSHGYLRVIDESGEDYGYSAKRFYLLELPAVLKKALGFKNPRKTTRPRRRLAV